MADALDSKSSKGNLVWVQVPPPVLVTVLSGALSRGRRRRSIAQGSQVVAIEPRRVCVTG